MRIRRCEGARSLRSRQPFNVMAGHSRLQDGVASHAYVPAIHAFPCREQGVDARHNAGHDEREVATAIISMLRTMPPAGGNSGPCDGDFKAIRTN
jgi:hypothetical protein